MAVRGGQGQERGGRGDAQWTVCYTSINVLKQAVDSKRASLPSSLWGGGQSSVLCGILKGYGQRRGKAAPGGTNPGLLHTDPGGLGQGVGGSQV